MRACVEPTCKVHQRLLFFAFLSLLLLFLREESSRDERFSFFFFFPLLRSLLWRLWCELLLRRLSSSESESLLLSLLEELALSLELLSELGLGLRLRFRDRSFFFFDSLLLFFFWLRRSSSLSDAHTSARVLVGAGRAAEEEEGTAGPTAVASESCNCVQRLARSSASRFALCLIRAASLRRRSSAQSMAAN